MSNSCRSRPTGTILQARALERWRVHTRLSAVDRSAPQSGGRFRSTVALEASAARLHSARAVHPGCRGSGQIIAIGEVGVARGLCGGCHMAGRPLGGGQSVITPVRSGRPRRNGRTLAATHLHAGQPARARDHRDCVVCATAMPISRCCAGCAIWASASPWTIFWNGVLFAGLSAAVPVLEDQDRPQFHQRPARQ